jgi:hypothetical protein
MLVIIATQEADESTALDDILIATCEKFTKGPMV